ncbi:O-antigen ligase family protein [uncultured Sulfitobacter sp.]|uniref:O-antigen ligase family protein n=1 Tax=uncultured Sulfitobacter sp. TaxID=191468 RepID=UPI0030F59215
MIPLSISAVALIMSFLKIKGLGRIRHVLCFLALGAGQIHLAVIALILLFVSEDGYLPPARFPRGPTLLAVTCVGLVVMITLLSPVSGRILGEIVQLLIYALIFVLATIYLRRPGRIEPLLHAMVIAATIVALLGIAGQLTGFTQSPHIFIGRGGNEGSVFLLLSGVVPSITLFIKTRRIIYLLLPLLMLFAQVLAQSRANMAVSLLVLVSPVYFLIGARWLRVVILLVVLGLLYAALPTLQSLFRQQQDFSTLQRLALLDVGWALWLERPWLGWGWGATSELVPQNTLTYDAYPHFHNTYIQLLVELGALGWLAIVVWVGGSLWLVSVGAVHRVDLPGGFYIAVISVAVLAEGLTSALLFGADRAVQVMIILALIGAFLRRRRVTVKQAAGQAAHSDPERPLL